MTRHRRVPGREGRPKDQVCIIEREGCPQDACRLADWNMTRNRRVPGREARPKAQVPNWPLHEIRSWFVLLSCACACDLARVGPQGWPKRGMKSYALLVMSRSEPEGGTRRKPTTGGEGPTGDPHRTHTDMTSCSFDVEAFVHESILLLLWPHASVSNKEGA